MGLRRPRKEPQELRSSIGEKLRHFIVFDEHFRKPFQLFLKLVSEVFFRTFLNKGFKGV